MRKLKTALITLATAILLIACTDRVAIAATGKSLLLGKANKAGQQTSLARTTTGPALKLTTRSVASAPLVVNGKGKVANLNADTVDGVDASALRTAGHVFSYDVTDPTTHIDLVAALPPGNYTVSYAAHLYDTQDGDAECYLKRRAGEDVTFVATSRLQTGGANPGLTGTGFVTVAAGVTISLRCIASNEFVTSSDEPIQVVATRLDVTTAGALTPALAEPQD